MDKWSGIDEHIPEIRLVSKPLNLSEADTRSHPIKKHRNRWKFQRWNLYIKPNLTCGTSSMTFHSNSPRKTSSIDKFERLARWWHTKTRYWLKMFVVCVRRRWPTFPRLIICVSEISPATRDTESFFRNYHKNRTVPIFHRQTRNGAFRCRRKKAKPASRPRRRQKCKD